MAKLDSNCGQLSPKIALKKKRIVSTPRKKKGEVKVGVSCRLPPAESEELKYIADRLKISKSELITRAIARCKNDGIWRKTAKKNKPWKTVNSPPKELVDMTNVLLELAFALESVMKQNPDPKHLDRASRIYLDARAGIASLQKEFGC